MTRAREIAEQANNNVWLIFIQRVMSVIVGPLCIVAVLSYMALRDRVTIAEAKLTVAEGDIRTLQTVALALRADLTIQAGAVTRLQAQQEGTAQIGQRINELREDQQRANADLRAEVRAMTGRLDQMMTPSRRAVP